MFNQENTHLYNGFYRAKVVDNIDPLHANRIKVRILGLHSQNTNDSLTDGIPDDNLPFCEQAGMFLEGSIIPSIGSWVWVFFDNGNFQKPVYFAKCKINNSINPELDDPDRLAQPKNDEIVEFVMNEMSIKSAKTMHGRKIEIKNLESGAVIKLDQFNGKSRIVMGADLIMIDGEIAGGRDVKGYPLLSEKKGGKEIINGMPFRTAKSSYS